MILCYLDLGEELLLPLLPPIMFSIEINNIRLVFEANYSNFSVNT